MTQTQFPEPASKRTYPRIDVFRVAAALLVVAIHTYPLMSMGELPDFILTQILARVAVPFFFMASGFFLLPSYINKTNIDKTRQNSLADGKEKKFLKKSLLLYGISILLYLPVNLYSGYFNMDHPVPNIAKDIVFDGTFYHLWYLPASILGVLLVCFLLKKLSFRTTAVIALLLYSVGLFGDSYYGLASQVPPLKSFYDAIFFFSDYTRNGIFFAPIFLLLGGYLGSEKSSGVKIALLQDAHARTPDGSDAGIAGPKRRFILLGLLVSAVLLLVEGLTLHTLDLQRHTSMYIMLLPCMYFLFAALLLPSSGRETANAESSGKRGRHLRNISMIVYLVHPLFIILVRGFSKIIGLQELFIQNSVIHYLAVASSSCFFAAILSIIIEKAHAFSKARRKKEF